MRSNKKKLILSFIGLAILLLVVVGATFAYFSASASNNTVVAGNTSEAANLELTITKMDSATEGLIPMYDNLANKGITNDCIDSNGNTVCHVYDIEIKNGKSKVMITGNVNFTSYSNSNIVYDIIFSDIADGASSEKNLDDLAEEVGTTTTGTSYSTPGVLTSKTSFDVNETKHYYLVVWLHDTNNAQQDVDGGKENGYTGTVSFNAVDGDGKNSGVTAVFSTSDNQSSDEPDDGIIDATFYYNSNNAAGNLTVASTTVATECETGSDCTITVPSVVTSSVGKYNSSYDGVADETSSLEDASLEITSDTTYYAFYSNEVTNYYYDDEAKTRTLYRNEYLTSTSAMNTVLSTTSTGLTTEVSTLSDTGPGNGTYVGVSGDNNGSVEYTTLADAVNSDSTTLYDAYQLTVNYAAGTNVTAVGATSASCNVISTKTSCTVTAPSVTASSDEYDATSWDTEEDSTNGVEAGETLTISSNNETYYASAYTEEGGTPKLLLLANNVAEYIYDNNTYTKSSAYGNTTIKNVYLGNNTTVPKMSNYTEQICVKTVNFTNSFKKYKPNNASYMFNDYRYMSTITNPENFDTSNVTIMTNMFQYVGYYATTVNLDLSSWNISKVTNMYYLFLSAGANATTFNLDLSNWNTSNVTDMYGMFYYAGQNATTFNLNISNWNTSNVTTMYDMFYNAGNKATTWSIGDISNWNTSKVANMMSMFESSGQNATTWNIDISNWDTSNVTSMSNMFAFAGNNSTTWSIGDISNWNTSKVTNMSNMFYNAGNKAITWNIGDLSNWNTSKVTDMSKMFYHAGQKATTWSIGDLNNWDTSSVTTMASMFSSAGAAATTWNIGNLSSWNTSKVTDMSSMFSYAGVTTTTWSIGDISDWNILNVNNIVYMFYGTGYSSTTFNLNLSNWNISNIINMNNMFTNAGRNSNIFNLNLSNWNTSSVTNMRGMFSSAGANATTFNLNLGNWNTSKVTDMSYMFDGAGGKATTWNIGNLSNWDTSSVTTMASMFSFAGNKATTWNIGDLSNWNTSKVTDMSSMFFKTGSNSTIFNLNLSNWNTSKVINMFSMFAHAGYSSTTFNLNLSNWNTSNVTNMYGMFEYAGRLATTFNLDISNWNTIKVTNMSHMFSNTGENSQTFNLNLSNWNTSNVTNMYNMFYYAGWYATTWTIGDISNWNVSNVTNMSDMFRSAGYRTTNLNLDISNWDTSKVTDMSNMFSSAGGNATTFNLNLGNWNTSNVTNMSSMFFKTGSNSTIFNLNLSNWNTSKVINMSFMFSQMKSVKTIYVGGEWNTENVTGSTSMFNGTTNLVGGNGTIYNESYIDKTYAHIDGYGGAGYLTFGGNSTYTINVSANNSSYGSVSGGGIKTSVTNITVTATPNSGYEFIGWYENDTLVSDDKNYTFMVYKDRTLEARFGEIVSVIVNSENTTYGTVSGGGNYPIGKKITITAVSNSSYVFTGWYNGDTLVNRGSNYTFTVSEAITLTAHFSTKGYEVELVSGGSSYGFEQITGTTSDTTPVTNPKLADGYEMYGSLNKGKDGTYAVMKVTILGYTSFTLYINSYAQSYYDYMIVSKLDATSYPTYVWATTSYTNANTNGKQYNPNTFDTTNYKTVTFTGIDEGKHYFYIVYIKDNSGSSNNDRGYVLIDPNQ